MKMSEAIVPCPWMLSRPPLTAGERGWVETPQGIVLIETFPFFTAPRLCHNVRCTFSIQRGAQAWRQDRYLCYFPSPQGFSKFAHHFGRRVAAAHPEAWR